MAKPCELIGRKYYLENVTNADGFWYVQRSVNDLIATSNNPVYKNQRELAEKFGTFDFRLDIRDENIWTKDSGCKGDYINGTQYCEWNFTEKKPHPLTVTGYAAKNVDCFSDKVVGKFPFTKKNCVSNRDGKTYPLYLGELYANACKDWGISDSFAQPDTPHRKKFCDSITDLAGNKRVPRACGGNDPDVIDNDITGIAIENSQNELSQISERVQNEINKAIKDKRKKVIFLVMMLAVIIYVIYY